MDKFSKIKKVNDNNVPDSGTTFKDFQILNHEDWSFMKENDVVAILPYFVDDGHIFLRSEYVPTYQYGFKDDRQFKNMKNFLTVITANIENGETPANAVRRELYEDTGIVLISSFPIEISNPLFINKKNCSRCYLCLLEIRYNDYRQTAPKNAGIDMENRPQTVKIDLGYLENIKTFDLITELMLSKLVMSLPQKKQY